MPQDKDIKRLVRARMVGTGERYTDAKAAIDSRPRGEVGRHDEPEATAHPQDALDAYFRAWNAWLRTIAHEARRNTPTWRHDEPKPPVDAARWGALHHPNARVRRDCLNILDHHANDDSLDVFRAALKDPVPRVREIALHGLACERCRTTELCVTDVAPDLIRALQTDSSAKVRHGTVGVLARLAGRNERIVAALRQAATDDEDPFVRQVAQAAVDGRRRDIRSAKALRRRAGPAAIAADKS